MSANLWATRLWMGWRRKIWGILAGVLGEISDQSAYQRYLAANGLVDSGEAWRRFSDIRMERKYQRAKCC